MLRRFAQEASSALGVTRNPTSAFEALSGRPLPCPQTAAVGQEQSLTPTCKVSQWRMAVQAQRAGA